MEICGKCKLSQSLRNFNKDAKGKGGIRNTCKKCLKGYRKDNKEQLASYQKEYQRTYSKEKRARSDRKWRLNNLDELKVKRKLWVDKNPDYAKLYSKNNRAAFNFNGSVRRSLKKNATPEWFEKDKIKLLYKKAKWLERLTGLKYHVDHIIPLNHPEVCGLHVWANLQILEKSENLKKSNILLL